MEDEYVCRLCERIKIAKNIFALATIGYKTNVKISEDKNVIYEQNGKYIIVPPADVIDKSEYSNENAVNEIDKENNNIGLEIPDDQEEIEAFDDLDKFDEDCDETEKSTEFRPDLCYTDCYKVVDLISKYGSDNIEDALKKYTEENAEYGCIVFYDNSTKEYVDYGLTCEDLSIYLDFFDLLNGPDFYNDDESSLVGAVGDKCVIDQKFYNKILDNLKQGNIDLCISLLEDMNNLFISLAKAEHEKYAEVNKMLVEDKNSNNKLENLEASLEKLNNLVGMENIKVEIDKLTKYLKFIEKTNEYTEIEKPNLNMIFTGNPGTGKTTVAKIITSILNNLGYTQCNKVVETTSKDFIGEYVGQTGPKTAKLLEKAKGGVLFVDEAYSFASSGNSFAQEALAEILKEMEKRDIIFILSGYKNEMEAFIKSNSGLASRIGSYFDFKDYDTNELYNMFENKLNKSKMKLDEECKNIIIKIIDQAKNEKNFGNGRFISNLYNNIIKQHAYNTFESNDVQQLITITTKDIDSKLLDQIVYKDNQKTIGFGK